MALTPTNSAHALQIQAGTNGRREGHEFEFQLAERINRLSINDILHSPKHSLNVFKGDPVTTLVNKAIAFLGLKHFERIEAIALGALATAEEGKNWLQVHGIPVKACKSDVLITFYNAGMHATVGISIKQCTKATPTNAQLYFTTATAFVNLLLRNGIPVSDTALIALKQFCGDPGFNPVDNGTSSRRLTDPRRYFWEEINPAGKTELENIFTIYQDKITRLLLQKAYIDDPFIPDLLIHKTKLIPTGDQEYALYTIDELVTLSNQYAGFEKKSYSVKKGQYKDPIGVQHEAPRFGIVQMQRGGQKQHPTQLQFNLQAGYFYKI